MIILLHGDDTYRARRKLNEIMEEHKKKHKSGLNLRYIDAGNIDFEDLRNEMLGTSMFKEKKLIVLLDAFSNARIKEELTDKGSVFADSDNILLLFESQAVPEKEKLYSFLKKNAKIQEFAPLKGKKLRDWVVNEFKAKDGKINDKALDLLIDYVQGDSWSMSNEITKLINYAPKGIKEEDVMLLVKPRLETNIFDTIDAIANKDKKKAFDLLKTHIEKGDSAIYLLAMIASQIRNIISVKGSEERINMNPFVMRKSIQQAINFSLDDLKKIYQRILQLDSEIKVGKVDQNIALDILISEI